MHVIPVEPRPDGPTALDGPTLWRPRSRDSASPTSSGGSFGPGETSTPSARPLASILYRFLARKRGITLDRIAAALGLRLAEVGRRGRTPASPKWAGPR